MVSASMMSSSLVAAAAGMRAAGTLGARSPTTVPHSPVLPHRRVPAIVQARSNKKPDVDPMTEEPITTAPPEEKKKALWDALAFRGPGPERINGRVAMVGFVAALAVEASRGVGLLSHAGDGTGLAWFAYTAVVLSAASLAPLLQGESVEGRSGGIWTADAELWNGRAAMLGLVALAATEYLTGSPLTSA